MKTIDYNGQRVYTQGNVAVSLDDLAKAKIEEGRIIDAYFFKLTPDRLVQRTSFDRESIEKKNSGLIIDVKSNSWGQASLSISGLDNIIGFLNDTDSFNNGLKSLKGRKTYNYDRGTHLLGIGVRER